MCRGPVDYDEGYTDIVCETCHELTEHHWDKCLGCGLVRVACLVCDAERLERVS